MKKNNCKSLIFACAFLCVCMLLTACNSSETTAYNVIKTTETYEPTVRPISGAVLDKEITVDGVFDEEFYDKLHWYEGIKNNGAFTGRLKTTTHIAKNGILIAAEVHDDWLISYNPSRITANNSSIEFYFAFGDSVRNNGNVFEIEVSAMADIRIRVWNNGAFGAFAYDYANAPYYATTRVGNIEDGTCTSYSIELYLPYSMFKRTKRPEFVYINPGMITPLDAIKESVDWYIFGLKQSPEVCGWGTVRAYMFDKHGFVSNDITIRTTGGGSVREEYEYDWCVTGDRVNFFAVADVGKSLTAFKVNGVDKLSAVDRVTGMFSMICDGDIQIEAVFA